jgi:hypothetical protein
LIRSIASLTVSRPLALETTTGLPLPTGLVETAPIAEVQSDAMPVVRKERRPTGGSMARPFILSVLTYAVLFNSGIFSN